MSALRMQHASKATEMQQQWEWQGSVDPEDWPRGTYVELKRNARFVIDANDTGRPAMKGERGCVIAWEHRVKYADGNRYGHTIQVRLDGDRIVRVKNHNFQVQGFLKQLRQEALGAIPSTHDIPEPDREPRRDRRDEARGPDPEPQDRLPQAEDPCQGPGPRTRAPQSDACCGGAIGWAIALLGVSIALVWVGTRMQQDTKPEYNALPITLRKIEGEPWGISVKTSESALCVQTIKPGLIANWNRKYPEKAIHIGDDIVEVNGISGNGKRMKTELQESRIVEIVIRSSPGLSLPEGNGKGGVREEPEVSHILSPDLDRLLKDLNPSRTGTMLPAPSIPLSVPLLGWMFPSNAESSRKQQETMAESEIARILALRYPTEILGDGTLKEQQGEFLRIIRLLHPDKGLVRSGDPKATLALRLVLAAHSRARNT